MCFTVPTVGFVEDRERVTEGEEGQNEWKDGEKEEGLRNEDKQKARERKCEKPREREGSGK